MVNGHCFERLTFLGVAILLNGSLFGVLTQQFYSYWTSGFKDRAYIEAFVIVQFCFATLQCVMHFHLAWNLFVLGYCQAPNLKSHTWQAPVSSVCACILILMANMFLACRIHGLTQSRLQSGLIVVLSATAFAFGVCTLILPWTSKDSAFANTDFNNTAESATTIIWHVLQVTSEFFISAFLIRALLNNRTGFKKTDSLVQYLMSRVVQLGLFAAIWSSAGLATWFLLPRHPIYALFEMTVGAIYTHMIFDTLLSRTRLRKHMNEETNFEMEFPSQLRDDGSRAQQLAFRIVTTGSLSMLTTTMPHLASSTANTPILGHVTKDDVSEIVCAPVGQAGVRYEAPHTPHDEV